MTPRVPFGSTLACFAALSVAAATAPACVRQPKPRKVEGTVVAPPGGGERRDGDLDGRDPTVPGVTASPEGQLPAVDANPPATGSPDAGNGTAVAVATAEASPVAVASMAPTNAPSPAATATEAPSITLRNVFSGGYFKNCVSLRSPGGAWARFGCTKKHSSTAGECVGLDRDFLAPLKVSPAVAGANRFELKIETFRQTKVCAGDTFAYDVGGTRLDSNPNPPSGAARMRFRCGRKAVGGADRVKVCFEDSTDANFKDLILLFDAKGGARLEIEGIEPKCVDDVKPEIENDC